MVGVQLLCCSVPMSIFMAFQCFYNYFKIGANLIVLRAHSPCHKQCLSCTADINECAIQSLCHANASCTNTLGSFTCACDTGYSGDGMTCSGRCSKAISQHACHIACFKHQCFHTFVLMIQTKAYQWNELHCCNLPTPDIDECMTDYSCHSNASCTNTLGSFTCTCNTGYSGDGMMCFGMC